ncbi:predicted protein [Naegleria gruberi]|uniref:Predicted protein n=1 Tax=Naegleria gruberi TaxID=5762 RepID=D2VBU7_NAEGR|nr:uncharacterized protein NAEGRDRAFT_66340 [Naegleria gruberi]EFC45531.1 predicted protein [Naegleria gruberi]|eukprot:XP_002678275.1 predicted protein [Naegleria gruberi strain NEG-M]
MSDIASDFETVPEPYKIKVVEPIKLIARQEREVAIKEAGLNQFLLKSDDVFIDLLTDSGTGAMSQNQWAGMMLGDESYTGSRNYYNLQKSVEDILGFKYYCPTHQGRGAENILFGIIIKKGQYILGNYHFDTTKAHIELNSGLAVNLIHERAYNTSVEHPFKGNIDLEKLEHFIVEKTPEKIAFLLMTITCNSVGGQPVSMENLRGAYQVAKKYNLPIFIDAARFAENAYFIKKREAEMFSYSDGCTMSAKKDGLVNIGGMIGIKEDEELFKKVKQRCVPMEGFPTYGGLAGRDMEALAIGMREVVDEAYLASRIDQVEYLGRKLKEAGIPIQQPLGGHAVFINAKEFLPHIPQTQYPAQALCVELYLEGGVRAVEVGTLLAGRDPETGLEILPELDLLRLTIPRRVYTNNHMDWVATCLKRIAARKDRIRGLKIVEEPPILRHFMARFDWAE